MSLDFKDIESIKTATFLNKKKYMLLKLFNLNIVLDITVNH